MSLTYWAANKRRGPRLGPVKIVVSKKKSVLMVYDREGQIIFYAPVTSGSEHDPLPFGNWVITDVVRNPTYNYNPDFVLGRRSSKCQGEDRSGSKQSGGCCLDGDQRTALRDTRHAGSGGDRSFRVSRVRANDKLGRHQGRRPGPRWNAGRVRGMRKRSSRYEGPRTYKITQLRQTLEGIHRRVPALRETPGCAAYSARRIGRVNPDGEVECGRSVACLDVAHRYLEE